MKKPKAVADLAEQGENAAPVVVVDGVDLAQIIAPVTEGVDPAQAIAPVTEGVDPVPTIAPVVEGVDPVQSTAPVVESVGPVQVTAPVAEGVDPVQNAAPVLDEGYLLHDGGPVVYDVNQEPSAASGGDIVDQVQDDTPFKHLFTVQVVRSPAGKRTRAGMSFTSSVSDPIDFSTLTQAQLESLASDPYLRIKPFKG